MISEKCMKDKIYVVESGGEESSTMFHVKGLCLGYQLSIVPYYINSEIFVDTHIGSGKLIYEESFETIDEAMEYIIKLTNRYYENEVLNDKQIAMIRNFILDESTIVTINQRDKA